MSKSTENAGRENKAQTSPVLDLAVGAFFAIICAAGWSSVLSGKRLMASLDAGLDPGAGFLPVLVLGLLSLGAALILIKGCFRLVTGRTDGYGMESADHPAAVALLLSMIALCAGVAVIGFLPATFVFSAAWTAWLSWRRTGRLARALVSGLILSVLLCVFLYVTFVSVLKVPIG